MKRKPKPKLEVVCARTETTPDHVAIYEYSHVDKKTGEVDHAWHPVIDLRNGKVDCDCPDFSCRRFPRARDEHIRPDIGTPRFQCRHIQAAINDCIDRRDIILEPQGIHREALTYEQRTSAG